MGCKWNCVKNRKQLEIEFLTNKELTSFKLTIRIKNAACNKT
jgi:hypothetical protein